MFGFSALLGAITTFLPDPEIGRPLVSESVLLDVLLAVLLAPLVETFIFQMLIIEVVRKIIPRPKKNIVLALLLSSTAFALNHPYSLSYIAFTFFVGLVLALAYYLARYRREDAFLLVFCIHSLYNSSATLYNFLFYPG